MYTATLATKYDTKLVTMRPILTCMELSTECREIFCRDHVEGNFGNLFQSVCVSAMFGTIFMGLENMGTIVVETVQHIRRRNEYHNRAILM